MNAKFIKQKEASGAEKAPTITFPFKTCIEFEFIISNHIVSNPGYASLTIDGLKIAQDWLCEKYGNNKCRRAKRIQTLRRFAYNLIAGGSK